VDQCLHLRNPCWLSGCALLAGKALGANQIEFVNLVVDYQAEHGVMDAGRLYESPFTDISSHGPDGLFTSLQIDDLVAILREARATAKAA
jgi:type I restriction enzyme R subunit